MQGFLEVISFSGISEDVLTKQEASSLWLNYRRAPDQKKINNCTQDRRCCAEEVY